MVGIKSRDLSKIYKLEFGQIGSIYTGPVRSMVNPLRHLELLLPLGVPTTTVKTERIIHFSDGPLQYPFYAV
jgi:hypothetical protein